MQKTTTEILNWIAEKYNEKNRSISYTSRGESEHCLYFGPDGKRCAISAMCVDTPEAETALRKIDNMGKSVDRHDTTYSNNMDVIREFMKPEFKGTPAGMSTLLRIEKEINRLRGTYVSQKIVLQGDEDKPIVITNSDEREARIAALIAKAQQKG